MSSGGMSGSVIHYMMSEFKLSLVCCCVVVSQGYRTGTVRTPHVQCVVNSPHYHTYGDFEKKIRKKIPSLLLPFVLTFPKVPK